MADFFGSNIGFLWNKLRGASNTILQTISDKVILPMKRHLTERETRKRRSTRRCQRRRRSGRRSTTLRTSTTTELVVRRYESTTDDSPLHLALLLSESEYQSTAGTKGTESTLRTTAKKNVARSRVPNSRDELLLRRSLQIRKPVNRTITDGTPAAIPIIPRRCQNSKNEPSLPRCLPLRQPVHRRPIFNTPVKTRVAARRCLEDPNDPQCLTMMKPIQSIHPKFLYSATKKRCTSTRCQKKRNAIKATVPGEQTDVICKRCTCAESSVYCANMNISVPFKLEDWSGLSDFAPLTVDLSHNPLSSITKISKLPIQVLNISNCYIHHFESKSLSYLDDINTLDLSHNKITASDLIDLCGPKETLSASRPFSRMLELNLASNAIHSLPQPMFILMNNLTFLDLSSNPLAYIDTDTMAAISMLTQLKHLLLRNCELETLPMGIFKNQKKLRWLDLSDNRFTTVPSVLQEVPKLSFLSLERNPIASIETKSAITKLTSLQELHLSHMSRLQEITAGALGGLMKLDILRLNHNQRLTNLDPEFLVSWNADQVRQWPSLRELYLNNNNLSTIHSQFLDGWEDLVEGDFSYNPYACDCDSQWMVNVLTPLVQNLRQKNTVYQMVCDRPAELRGVSFAYMSNTSKVLPCSSEVKNKPVPTNLVMTLGTMTGIIAALPIFIVLVVMLWKRYKRRNIRALIKTIRKYDANGLI